jgi:putative FmdB family regulatory protein
MPIFEYECSRCGARLERLVRSAADAPRTCPTCGAAGPRKVFSAFSVTASRGGGHEPSSACESCSEDSCPYSGDDAD